MALMLKLGAFVGVCFVFEIQLSFVCQIEIVVPKVLLAQFPCDL